MQIVRSVGRAHSLSLAGRQFVICFIAKIPWKYVKENAIVACVRDDEALHSGEQLEVGCRRRNPSVDPPGGRGSDVKSSEVIRCSLESRGPTDRTASIGAVGYR